jgi:hypothetical protein
MAGYSSNPTIIATVDTIKGEDETCFSDIVVGVQSFADAAYPSGRIDLDVRGAAKFDNFVIRVDAEDLVQALTRAMINRDAK